MILNTGTMSRKLLRTAATGALAGVSIYLSADILGEYTTYCNLRDQGLSFAHQDDALRTQLGTPFEDGPWYNASIGFTQSGHVAAITFPLKGSKQITDVTVRAVRRPGLPSAVLYNLQGGEWKVLDCTAMAPQPGGLVRPRSILPYQAVPTVLDGKVVAGDECEECNLKAAVTITAGSPSAASAGPPSGEVGGGGGDRAGPPEEAQSHGLEEKKRRRRFWVF